MVEFWSTLFLPTVLPTTLLLGVVLLYWLLVAVGALGTDLLELDLGLDTDGIDAVPVGVWPAVLNFLHLVEVPVTVVGSVFALLWWTTTMLSHQWFRPELGPVKGVLLLAGCAVASLIATSFAIRPLVPLFRSLNREDVERLKPGDIAQVSTSEVTDSSGEVTIQRNGPPVVLSARCRGARLPRGEWVRLVEYQPETSTWLVQLAKKPE